MVLRQAGYVVHEAYSLPEALKEALPDCIDVVLICHSVPRDNAEHLISALRAVRKSLPIVCVTLQGFQALEDCIAVANSPSELLNAVLRAA